MKKREANKYIFFIPICYYNLNIGVKRALPKGIHTKKGPSRRIALSDYQPG